MSAEPRGGDPLREAPFPIFLYHGICAEGAAARDRFAVGLGAFAAQMDLLAASGRRTSTIDELLRRRQAPEAPLAAVTFDDGTADFYERAWPVLRERGIAATLYVTSGLVGRDYLGSPMLSWSQLEELRDEGVEIGAHGDRHIPLDVVSPDRAAVEAANSKLTLEDRLQLPVTTFAYPYGYHTEYVKHLLQRAGYTSACGVKNCLSHPRDDRFALARLTISSGTSARRFEQLLDGRGAARAREDERVRTRLWRAYRRVRSRRIPLEVSPG